MIWSISVEGVLTGSGNGLLRGSRQIITRYTLYPDRVRTFIMSRRHHTSWTVVPLQVFTTCDICLAWTRDSYYWSLAGWTLLPSSLSPFSLYMYKLIAAAALPRSHWLIWITPNDHFFFSFLRLLPHQSIQYFGLPSDNLFPPTKVQNTRVGISVGFYRCYW